MATQKMKSNRSAAKRFKLKPNGKLKRIKGSKHHGNVHKAQSRIRRLKESDTIDGKKATLEVADKISNILFENSTVPSST